MNVRDSRRAWNAAPSLLVIRRNHQTGEVSLDGLIPYWCEDPEGCAPKAKTRHRFKRKRPRVRGQFAFLACRLIVVATAFLARDHAAVAPLDRSGHRPAVSPWANGHAAWADADGGV